MRVLIVYATSEGQTERIANQIAETLVRRGFPCDRYNVCRDRADEIAVDAYDAVVVGSSIHYGRHDPRIEWLVREYRRTLRRIPSAFFSVSLAMASENEEDRHAAMRIADAFLEEMLWQPSLRAYFSGRLAYSQYGWWKARLMHRIAAKSGAETSMDRDYEYTDWSKVDRFARRFAELLRVQKSRPHAIVVPEAKPIRSPRGPAAHAINLRQPQPGR